MRIACRSQIYQRIDTRLCTGKNDKRARKQKPIRHRQSTGIGRPDTQALTTLAERALRVAATGHGGFTTQQRRTRELLIWGHVRKNRVDGAVAHGESVRVKHQVIGSSRHGQAFAEKGRRNRKGCSRLAGSAGKIEVDTR